MSVGNGTIILEVAASEMIPIGQAASAGNLTFRSGATIVAKEGIATAAGAGAQKYTTDLTGNQTAGMIAGMAASMATAKGLNGIEAGAKKLAKLKLGDVGADGGAVLNDADVGSGVKSGSSTKPNQVHHFVTNKSKKYTSQFESITKKYGLDLGGDWNKQSMPHQGRHPYAYHDYVLDNMQKFDRIANGDKTKFLKLYDQMKQKIVNNPEMLYKDYWNK